MIKRVDVFYPEKSETVVHLDMDTDTGNVFLTMENMLLNLDTMSELRDILNDIRGKLLVDDYRRQKVTGELDA